MFAIVIVLVFKIFSFQIDELRQNILETIFHYAPGPKIVLTRLCVALSALVIHLVTGYWETAVKDIIHTLRTVEVRDRQSLTDAESLNIIKRAS